MTDDVAALVLKDNYDQTVALSVGAVARALGPRCFRAASCATLEAAACSIAPSSSFPTTKACAPVPARTAGLTRPELAVLLAYAKLDLFDAEIIESSLPDDPYLHRLLVSYFPPLAAERFKAEMETHRLKREIVATELVNRLVNLAGPLFVHRMQELTSAPARNYCAAYVVAEGVFGLEALKAKSTRSI